MTALSAARPIAIAISAMGGQGGGVLAQWIVNLAESKGWAAQSTSVPGVAQRTGATLYYVEMIEPSVGATPVFSLMPAPGDVDIVLAAEFMEAGRAMLRGLVTPDRTVLIASTHRSFAVSEKQGPGDRIGKSGAIADAAQFAAKRVILFDMEAIAKQEGSVISASLFGALAGSRALPFACGDFEAVIRRSEKGIEPSLRAFAAALEQARESAAPSLPSEPEKPPSPLPATSLHPSLNLLLERIRRDFAVPVQAMLFAGVSRLVDFQDVDYAVEYLDQVARFRAFDGESRSWALSLAAAKYIAGAMAYDDVISVADLKTRGSRFARVHREINAGAEQIVLATEFMRPRAEEAVGLMPERLGLWIEARPRLFRMIDAIVNRGRRVQTFKLRGFLTLYALSLLRAVRRRTLRHAREIEGLRLWIDLAIRHGPGNYDLAVEILNSRRLVKGYSDTLARGTSKFGRVQSAVPVLAPRSDGAEWMKRLVAISLRDEAGSELDGALRTVRAL